MALSNKIKQKLNKFKKQFKLIAPYKNADKLIIFPHSGYTFFFDNEHKKQFNKYINPEYKIGNEGIDYNFFKFLQETDIGFEHSVLPFLLSNEKKLQQRILPNDTWAFVNLGHRITAGDANRGCLEPEKILPMKTFTGMQLFDDQDKQKEYSSWIIKNHIKPFQSTFLEILKENPSIETIIHMHTLDPTSGFSNVKTDKDDTIRPIAQLFWEATIYPKLHSTFFKKEENKRPFDIEFLPLKVLKKAQSLFQKNLKKYYVGSKPEVLIDSPYCMKGYKGVCLSSLSAMHNRNLKQILVEANKACLSTFRKAGKEYLDLALQIHSIL